MKQPLMQHALTLANSQAASHVLKILERVDGGGHSTLRVLTYHRVDEPEARPYLSSGTLSATPDEFDIQMRFVAATYTPVNIRDVLAYFETGAKLPPNAVLITFDDAYCDFAQHVWGILQQYKIPVVLFVPTAYPDNPQRWLWWDKLYYAVKQTTQTVVVLPQKSMSLATPAERKRAFKKLRNHVKSLPHGEAVQCVDELCTQLQVEYCSDNGIIGWNDLRQLATEGVTLGAHTRTHPMLNRISVDDAVREAKESWDDLQHHIGETLPILAYPGGGANEEIAARLAQSGFKLAFTTERGINSLSKSNPLLLKRINVGRATSLNLLRAQLLSTAGSLLGFFVRKQA